MGIENEEFDIPQSLNEEKNNGVHKCKPIKKMPYMKNIKIGSQILHSLMKQIYAERSNKKDLAETLDLEEELTRKICGLKDGYGINKVMIMILHNMERHMKKSKKKLYETLWELKIMVPLNEKNLGLLFHKRKHINRRHSIDWSCSAKSNTDYSSTIVTECKDLGNSEKKKLVLVPLYNISDRYATFLDLLCETYAELCEFSGNMETIFYNNLKASSYGKYIKCGNLHKSLFYQEFLKDQIINVGLHLTNKNLENHSKLKERNKR